MHQSVITSSVSYRMRRTRCTSWTMLATLKAARNINPWAHRAQLTQRRRNLMCGEMNGMIRTIWSLDDFEEKSEEISDQLLLSCMADFDSQ